MPILADGWLTTILTSPITERAFYLVIVLMILGIVDRRLCQLISEVARLTANLAASQTALISQTAHQTSRMTEIRNFMRDLVRGSMDRPEV